MHNLKEIRKDYSKFEKDLEKRSVKIDFNNLKKKKKKIFQNLKMKVYLKNLKKYQRN